MTREERIRAPAGSCPSGLTRADAQVVHQKCHTRTQHPHALSLPSLQHIKLHGLKYICSPKLAFRHRTFWFLAFFTSLGFFLSWSSNRLLYLLSFPSHTRVQLEWSKELAFPAVTFCNNNPVRFHRLSKSDLYFAGYWLGLLFANRTARPMLAELLPEDRQKWFHKLADFRLFLPPRNFDGISVGFMDRLGHQLEDMLLSCKYRGEACGPHNFSTMIQTFSRCVLCCAEEVDLDELLASRLVSFLMDHHQDILQVPCYLQTAVQDHIQYLQRPRVKQGTVPEYYFCKQISAQEFEEQRLATSQAAIMELLENIVRDKALAVKDKKKKLKQFQKQYPDIYQSRFPTTESEAKLFGDKPTIKQPMLMLKKPKFKSLRY